MKSGACSNFHISAPPKQASLAYLTKQFGRMRGCIKDTPASYFIPEVHRF